MKVLFIGGTGLISTAVSDLAVQKGFELYLLNRGNNKDRVTDGANVICGDIRDEKTVSEIQSNYTFDVVVDFIGFKTEHVETDIRIFSGKVKQYIYISSASAYQKPVKNHIITEETPLENPFWEYSRLKIECEDRLKKEYIENGFPVTIVRPSLTYGDANIGTVLNSWKNPYTIVERIKNGKKIIIPGDGTSLWVMTHNTDFAKGLVGLIGNYKTIGESFHITSDEVLNWNTIYKILGEEIGVEPQIVHIPSDYIGMFSKDKLGSLLGDKAESVCFDNSKIKKYVPDFKATTSYREGAKLYLESCASDIRLREIDNEWNEFLDKIISSYEKAYEGL